MEGCLEKGNPLFFTLVLSKQLVYLPVVGLI